MLAQLVEHVTFNDVADGSNPSQDTIFLLFAPQFKTHVLMYASFEISAQLIKKPFTMLINFFNEEVYIKYMTNKKLNLTQRKIKFGPVV